MNDKEINILKKILQKNKVCWIPDSSKALQVKCVSTHQEESDDTLCAIFNNGQYAALYNSDLFEFKIVKEIEVE